MNDDTMHTTPEERLAAAGLVLPPAPSRAAATRPAMCTRWRASAGWR